MLCGCCAPYIELESNEQATAISAVCSSLRCNGLPYRKSPRMRKNRSRAELLGAFARFNAY